MVVAKKLSIVCLAMRICLTSAIMVTKPSLDSTNISRQRHSYLPPANPFPKHPNHQYDDHHIINSNLEKLGSSRNLHAEHSMGLQSASTLSNHKQKSQTGPQRFLTKIRQDVWLSAKVPNASPSPPPPLSTTTTVTTTSTLSGLQDIREYHRHVPRFADQDVKVLDRYLTDELDDDKLPYEKVETYYRRGPQDVTAVIKALDRFLSCTLNDDGYNSKVHPPPNPILALVLSRYGRYVPGPRNPRVYAYLAANNIHNHQPFGKYKYEFDEEPIYTRR